MMVRSAMGACVPLLLKLVEPARKRNAQRREAQQRAAELEIA
jgi:hypothetical protein